MEDHEFVTVYVLRLTSPWGNIKNTYIAFGWINNNIASFGLWGHILFWIWLPQGVLGEYNILEKGVFYQPPLSVKSKTLPKVFVPVLLWDNLLILALDWFQSLDFTKLAKYSHMSFILFETKNLLQRNFQALSKRLDKMCHRKITY